MNFKIRAILIWGFLIISGCSDTKLTEEALPQDVSESDVITTESRNLALSEEERGRKMTEHIKKYIELKEKNPKAAYVELRKSAELLFRGHVLAEEWTQLVYKIDGAGEASLFEMIHKYELELEMAKANSPYKEYIQHLENQLIFWKKKEEQLKEEGKDPELFKIKYSMKVQED